MMAIVVITLVVFGIGLGCLLAWCDKTGNGPG